MPRNEAHRSRNSTAPAIDALRTSAHPTALVRLREALAHTNVCGPTKLALEFNLRYAGQSVSMQAVHKWLNGTAIPSADKILTLAKWLKADPHWLRHGSPDAMQQRLDAHPEPQFNFSAEDVALLETFHRLDTSKKRLVKELLRVISQAAEPPSA